MVIEPRIEEPIRTMLGQAIRGELHEVDKMIGAVGDEVYGTGVEYCILAAAYIAIELSERWPNDADVKLPVLITAQMLLGFRHPQGMGLWEYLDAIWNACEVGARADMSILPALLIRQKRSQAAAKP